MTAVGACPLISLLEKEHEAISIRSLVATFGGFWNKGGGASSMQAADN